MKKVLIDTLKKYKWTVALMLILLAINSFLITCPPKIVGNMIDLLYEKEANKQNILNDTYYLLGVCIVYLCNRFAWKYLENYNVRKFEKDIKQKMFERLLKLKLKDIQKIKNGEIMSYFVKDMNEIRTTFYRIISHGGRSLLVFVLVIYQMINNIHPYLTIAMIIPILLAIYSIIKINRYTEMSFRKAQEMFTQMSEYIQESTDGIRTTKAYSCEGKQLKSFIRKNKKVRASNNTVDIYANLLKMSLHICFGLCHRNYTPIWLKISIRSEKLQ